MKKTTFREFFSTLFNGLWQAVCWLTGTGEYRNRSTYGKVLKRIVALCLTLLLIQFTTASLYDAIERMRYRTDLTNKVVGENFLSNRIVLQRLFSEKIRIYDKQKKKVLYDDFDWVVTSEDNDSLAVFARKGMRGYLHRRTGEIVIPEIYSHAWIFSEGLAAVEQNGNINFIDPSGKVVIDKDFPMYYDNKTDYVFTDGHCLMRNPANGKKGLIDKNGQWVLPAEYDELFFTRGFWQAEKDGRTGLYTADLKMLLPVEYQSIQVIDSIIEVHLADHSVRRYDHQGRVVVDFVIDEISSLRYEMPTPRNGNETCDNDTCATQKHYGTANCLQYLVRGDRYNETDGYGLLDRNGRRITPPRYTSIQAIGQHLYLCLPDGVILNDRGEVVQ